MADVAELQTPPARRRLVKPSMRWPLGFLTAAVVLFVYYYIATYFRGFVPDPVFEFMNEWLPLQPINGALIFVMAALGLNIVVGYAGLLDLGFVAFWAIGGYTAGWLMSGFFQKDGITFRFFGSEFTGRNNLGGIHINVWFVLIGAAILCAIFGVIIGAPTLRLRSDYLALVTLGFGEIINEVFYNGDNIFGQNISNGTQGINPVDSVRFFKFDNTGKLTWGDVGPFDLLPKFVLFVLLAALILFASIRIREGKLGRAWLAIREDELAASAMGVPLMRTKLAAYSLGAIAGGFAGVAFAIHVSGVFPQFNFSISILLVAMVVLGGMGNVWGVAIGALILAWTNITMLPKVENAIVGSEASRNATVAVMFIAVPTLIALGVYLHRKGRGVGVLAFFLAGLALIIGGVLFISEEPVSFQFLIFGSVLVLMMLFRREGLIPEARTRLVLREQGRTDAESLGADMEEVAPELEAMPDESIHAGGTMPSTDRDGDGGRHRA
jgi:branched-chain amino acid transport system permease protein